jgi:hypothetical protein
MWLGSKATGGYRRSALCRCAVVALLLFCDRSSGRPIRRVLGRRGSFRRAPAQHVGDRLNAHLPTDPIGASSRTRARTRTHARTHTHAHARTRTHARTHTHLSLVGGAGPTRLRREDGCDRRRARACEAELFKATGQSGYEPAHAAHTARYLTRQGSHPARYPTQQYPAQHGTWSGGAMRLETGYEPAHRRDHRRLRRSLGRAHTQRCPPLVAAALMASKHCAKLNPRGGRPM